MPSLPSVPPSTLAPSASNRSLQAVDFSTNAAVMHVSTALRRLWLSDPASFGPESGDSDPADAKNLFRTAIQQLSTSMASATLEERWNDDLWRSRTKHALLDPPLASSTGASTPELQSSLFTPFRREIYGVYDNVFWDVYEALRDESRETGREIGEFKPPGTTIMLLNIPQDGPLHVHHRFDTDTFVYPVWIESNTSITFSVEGIQITVVPDGHTWTSAMWFEAGKSITITLTVPVGQTCCGPVAVLALGGCEPRSRPEPLPPSQTIARARLDPSQAKLGDPSDERAPESWPEADHLARAIFLSAGDGVEICSFDDTYTGAVEQTPKTTGVHPAPAEKHTSLYSPLPGDYHIRVLVIEPGTAKDNLQTHLFATSLDDNQPFEAVSYTWGDPSDKTSLNCGGRAVSIPCNLDKFLRQLRHPSQPRYVWADSVCINQEDIHERGQQVSIMRHIYSKSSRVLVWLGADEAHEAERAFKTVCDIVRFWRPDADRLQFSSYANHLEPMDGQRLVQVREIVDETAWEALRAMFEVGYFRRFWIIQELALGSSAIVCWGNHRIRWGLVGICAAWLLTNGCNFHYGRPIEAAYNAFLIYVLPLAARSGISPFSKLDLSVVLGTTMGRFDSTDARDRIYALLGMQFAGNNPASPLLKPDYSESVRSVYISAAKRILEQDEHLRLLSAAQHGPDLDTISSQPSWVPQWDKHHHAEPLALRNEQGYFANGGEVFSFGIDTFSPDGEGLVVTGLLCGIIIDASEELKKGNLRFQALSKKSHQNIMMTILGQLNDESRQLRASWSATLEKFTLFGLSNPTIQAEVLASGNSRGAAVTAQPGKYGMRESVEILTGERAQNDHLGEFLLYWRERVSWRANDLQHEHMAPFWRLIESRGDPYEKERAMSSINVLIGRKVFQCEDGKVGLGPAATQPGDVVVVLFGAIIPFVLRPVDGPHGRRCWKLVGECLVPGLMQGEAVEEAGLLEPGTFDRNSSGQLTLSPVEPGGTDPRLHRTPGEHGVLAFELR